MNAIISGTVRFRNMLMREGSAFLSISGRSKRLPAQESQGCKKIGADNPGMVLLTPIVLMLF